MNLLTYAKALAQLPDDFLQEDHQKVPLCFFHDRLIVAHIDVFLVYNGAEWINCNDPRAWE